MTFKSYLLNRSLLLTGIVMMLTSLPMLSQQSFGGTPLAADVSLRSTTEHATQLVALDFNPSDLKVQDAWSSSRSGRPFNVGHMVDYSVDFAEQATLVHSVNGTQVYRLELALEGSPVGMGLYYEDFYIPEGGRLFIYTPDRRQLLGAYTHATHPTHGAFATEPLAGNQLVLDYEMPEGTAKPSIQISQVAYFYYPVMQIGMAQDGLEYYSSNEESSDPGLRKFCQINANCPEGDNYEDQKASSVAMLMPVGKNLSMCSGNLINNIKEDLTPYIISAAHCASETDRFGIPNYIMDQWIFAFHFEKPRCSSGDRGTQTLRSMVGARMKSFLPIKGASDGLLLELTNKIPEDYRVYYSGWNAATTTWQKGASLHHPAGDALKVSTFDGGVSLATWNRTIGGKNDHFSFLFNKGNTEGGSSGSPLYNDRGEQIGTLSGGAPGICPMDAVYGRLYAHYDKYKSKGDTWYMAKWLDPDNTGKKQVAGKWNGNWKPLQIVKELRASIVPNDPKKVKLEWDAVPNHEQGYAIAYNLYADGKLVKTLTETTYEDNITDARKQAGRVDYKVEAVYTIDGAPVATPAAYRSLYLGELDSQVTPSVSQGTAGVKLEWSMPYNTQIVSKIADRKKVSLLKAKHGAAGYAFQGLKINKVRMYDMYRLGQSPFGGQQLYIHQINFIPAMDTPLNSNGKPDYSQALSFFALQKKSGYQPLYNTIIVVPQGTAAKKEWMSVQLNKPIPLDDGYNLETGFVCNGNSNPTIYIDARSKDEYIDTEGCLRSFEVSGDRSMEILRYGHYSENRPGYQVMELVVSNNPNKQSGVTDRAYTRGPLPVPFPEVKSYVIYRDGVKVHETDANTYTWTDPEGKGDSKYRIEVIYDYPNELRPVEQITQVAPELYPVHFAETLQLSNPNEVLRVQLFNLQGVAVAEFSGAELAGLLDVSRLPEGAYVAVVTTAEGITTQKLVK